jgi:DNA-binding beta-propeller fold protein YncE/cytochrome c peroxidase
MRIWWPALAGTVLGLVAWPLSSSGQGFPNVPQTPGTLLTPLLAPEQGRTAVIAYHNGWLYTVPEMPSSQPGSDFLVRRWNLANLSNVTVAETYDETNHPVMAHGYLHLGDYLCLGDNWPPESPFSFRATAPGVNQRTSAPGLNGPYDRGDLFQPWHINTYWSYNPNEIDDLAVLKKNGQVLATWDHIGATGVIGHPFIFGNLLIFASDQSRTGVAVYDIGDPTNPRLLDVLKTGGPGGYWPELWGGDGRLLLVFPYQEPTQGMRVVDLTDPENLRLVSDVNLPGAETMYVQFQDEYAFLGSHKVDMRTFSSVLRLDTEGKQVDTSQFLLPLGNLLATGGVGEHQGLAIWAHQAAPDTRGPGVGYHLPRNGQTNYPRSAPISLLIHETLDSTTIKPGVTFIVRPLGGSHVPGKAVFSFDDILTFTPDQNLQANTTYEVILTAGGIKDVAGNGIEEHRFLFSTGATVSGNAAPSVTSFTASPHPARPGQAVAFSASGQDPENGALEYRFDFGDGSPKTAWSSSPSANHVYAAKGRHLAKVHVRDTGGLVTIAVHTVTVTNESATNTPPRSTEVEVDATRRTVWTVNPDHGTVTAFDADSLARRFEAVVGEEPRGLAIDPQGRAWVACRRGDRIARVRTDGTTLPPIPLAYGDAPHGIVIHPGGASAFVSLSGSGEVIRIDTASGAITGRLALGPGPRALAISPNGATLYVSRFISARDHGEVWRVNTATMTLAGTIRLDKLGNNAHRDSPAEGKGTPNYLAGLAVTKDGSRLLVVSNKMNSDKGLLVGADLDQDNTVRNLLTLVDTATNEVLKSIDLDNSDSASAVAVGPLDDYFFATLQGNNDLAVFDRFEVDRSAGFGGFVTRQRVGSAPRGLAIDPVTGRLFVKNDLGRDLTIFELDDFFSAGRADFPRQSVATTSTEVLPEPVLRGKRIFHHAGDPRMSGEGYLSCATCHADGGFDGRTWDFTGRGEGLRNTTSLNGRAGTRQGNVHWSANFDEIQDFEHDIRTQFGGTGFLTDSQFAATSTPLGAPKAGLNPDLDALAAYLASLDHGRIPKSPHRAADASLTAEALSGKAVFEREGCAVCHSGPEMTDGLLHDVGTTGTASGARLGGTLSGIETPTLRGLWESAPYLHDGSATTLAEVFTATGGTQVPGESGTITGGGEITTEWTYYNNDETVRGEALAQTWDGGVLTLAGIDGGPGGTGAITLRYSLGYSGGTVRVRVNGTNHTATVSVTGNVPDWRYVNWQTVRVENVALSAGPNNTIQISAVSPDWLPLGIDEVTVSAAPKLAAAEPHRRVARLNATERSQLLAFLLQLDGSPLPGQAETPPATPRGLTLTPEGPGALLLAWNDAPGTASYRIHRGASGDFAASEVIGTTTQRRFRDPAPPLTGAAYYWVVGINAFGESAPGDGFRFATEPPQPDLRIGPSLTKLVGDGIYAPPQAHLQILGWRGNAKTWILLENDGAAAPIRLRASAGTDSFSFAYFDGNGENTTARLLTDRLTLEQLKGKAGRFEIRTRHRGNETRGSAVIVARAAEDSSKLDRVVLRLQVR